MPVLGLYHGGRVRVSDFGLARTLADGTRPGGGTPGFLAPEQLDPDGAAVSPRTDVHGLGATLYALLAGRAPFAADRSAGDEPPSLTSLRPDVPAGVEALCRRCLAADPAARPASAAEVAAELRSLAASCR